MKLNFGIKTIYQAVREGLEDLDKRADEICEMDKICKHNLNVYGRITHLVTGRSSLVPIVRNGQAKLDEVVCTELESIGISLCDFMKDEDAALEVLRETASSAQGLHEIWNTFVNITMASLEQSKLHASVLSQQIKFSELAFEVESLCSDKVLSCLTDFLNRCEKERRESNSFFMRLFQKTENQEDIG